MAASTKLVRRKFIAQTQQKKSDALPIDNGCRLPREAALIQPVIGAAIKGAGGLRKLRLFNALRNGSSEIEMSDGPQQNMN